MKKVFAFGEILWDIIDDVPHLGGAPFNFAAHLRQCGIPTAILSSVGKDSLGERAGRAVRQLDVADDFLLIDAKRPTGTVSVTLKDGIPSYTIHEDVAWDAIAYSSEVQFPDQIAAFYFGTLAQRSPLSRQTLFQLLDRYSKAPVFLDVNLRQKFRDREILDQSMQKATILKINDEEARVLAALFFDQDQSFDSLSRRLFQRYPKLQILIITLGAEGCRVIQRNGDSKHIPAKKVHVVDTVGSGDAFSAAFLAALLRGETPFQAAEDGNARGGWVASFAGAIVGSSLF